MTFKGVFSFNFSTASEFKSFFGAGIGFHFRHNCKLEYYFFFGLIIIIIFFPWRSGIFSKTPYSSSSCANFNNNISPLSL